MTGSVEYLLCDLVTGQVLTELPLAGGDRLRRIIGREEQATLTLAWADPMCPDDWADLVVPGKTMIVQVLDEVPVQAWAVMDTVVGGDTVSIPCVTLEHCLARTNCPDVDHYGDEGDAAAMVLAPLISRFGFTVVTAQTGREIDTWLDVTEDRTVLDWITSLSAASEGPEWRITLAWDDAGTRQAIAKTIEVRPRIGHDRPDAVFDLGCVTAYTRTRSYGPGKGATLVTGVSEGSGSARPMTEPLTSHLVEAGWPVWEDRPRFDGLDAPSIDDEDAELLRLAREALSQRETGTVVWAVTGDETAPRPGSDFSEGR